VKELYNENYKTRWKKQKTQKSRDTLCSWTRINIVKMSILSKAIYRFKVIPTKTIPMAFFTELEKKFKNSYGITKRLWIPKAILSIKKYIYIDAEGIMLPYFKTYYKGVIIKIAWYWYKTDTLTNGTEQAA
jgi:hypothetical protein